MTLSPQLPEYLAAWIREDEIPYPILTDPGNGVADTYGIRYALPGYLRDVYLDPMGIDLVRHNGDESWTLPQPATFVIRPDGTLAFTGVDPDYRVRPEPDELLDELREL